MLFCKFTDCSDYIFYHIFAMGDFGRESDCNLSVKRICYPADGIKSQSLSTFDFGYGSTTHTDSFSDICLSHSEHTSSLREKFTYSFKFIFHAILFL